MHCNLDIGNKHLAQSLLNTNSDYWRNIEEDSDISPYSPTVDEWLNAYNFEGVNDVDDVDDVDTGSIKLLKYNSPSKWDREEKCWVNDEYLDYSIFQDHLYSKNAKSWSVPYRDFIFVKHLTGFDEFDDKIFYHYYTHSLKEYIGRGGCIIRSKFDCRDFLQLDGDVDHAYLKSVPMIASPIDNVPEYSWYLGYGILLSDAIELSKKYGKILVMDLIKESISLDEFKIDEEHVAEQVELIMNKSV